MSIDKRINIFDLLKNEGKLDKILVYPSVKVENDPYEKTKDITFLNPLTILGYVRNVSTEALTWKYYGNMPIGSKEILCEKKYKTLLTTADKIKIGDEFFKVYHDDSKGFGIISRADYLVVILKLKNVNIDNFTE